MIVPMKKVFLVLLEAEKRQALKSLRKLGLVHLEELEGHSEELSLLKGQQSNLETGSSIGVCLFDSSLYSVAFIYNLIICYGVQCCQRRQFNALVYGRV